ncbi:MAG: hypothetical protein JWL71_161 [Acidobacteria bacterium]|nr:hypothetical protein [Acidobacteriota bacterium]
MPDLAWRADEAHAPLVWRSLLLRLAVAAIPCWLTVPILISNVDRPIKMIVAVVLGLTLANPGAGLLLVALTAPLGELIAPMIGARTFRIGEVIVMTFLAGWLLRGLPDRRGPRVPGATAAWLLTATIAASVAGLAWQLGRYPGEVGGTLDQISHIYFFITDPIGFVDAARLLEGLGLAVATMMLFRRQPSLARTLPLALGMSAAGAALSSVLLSRGIGSAAALARYKLIGYRVSGHVGDVNAAGSYFALIGCLALGMAACERGRMRALWCALAAASGVGLWMSASRSALGAAAAVVIVAVTWAATKGVAARTRAALLTAVVIALIGGAAIRARLLDADPTYRGGGFREQFVEASVRMIRARPLFGVGEGQYYASSPLFLSPQLAWTYGAENAHNFFLQVGGELGLVGLGLFAAVVAAAVLRTGRALTWVPRDARLLGAGSGVAAFLITSFSGHPLLVSEVAYPFWIVFGLMSALAGSALLNQVMPGRVETSGSDAPRFRRSWPVAAAAAILIASPVIAAGTVMAPPASQSVDGFYAWETLKDGTRIRWTGQYASLFVPEDVSRVEIPVRLPAEGRLAPVGVEVMTGGVDRGRTLVDGTWAIISVPLAPAAPRVQFKRIDLRVDRVWQPALYIAGSADLRAVGVQVGEPRLFRD